MTTSSKIAYMPFHHCDSTPLALLAYGERDLDQFSLAIILRRGQDINNEKTEKCKR